MHKLHAAFAVTAALALGACSSDPISPGLTPDGAALGALAEGKNTVVVTEEDITRQPENTPPTDNWVYYFRTPTSTGVFRTGPGNPPLGVGSFELSTPTSGDKGTLFNYDHNGTLLADIDAMGYDTYRTVGNQQQVAAINMQVDVNGPAVGGFTTLVFEPVYNTAQGAVVSGAWQDWDAYLGGQAIWWSTRDLFDANGNLVACNPNGALALTPQCAGKLFVPWSTIVAAFPNAVISGGYGVNQGSGNPALITAVDALTIGYDGDQVTYDFEPYRVATSKDACKNGGWRSVRRADGSAFKNQGDCVSYMNTGR